MRNKKVFVTMLATLLVIGVTFIISAIVTKHHESNEESIVGLQLTGELSDYTGYVVVGLAVDSELCDAAIAAVENEIDRDTAVYIFAASYDRDGLPYISYTVYNRQDNTFIDKDADIDTEAEPSTQRIIRENENMRIDMRK